MFGNSRSFVRSRRARLGGFTLTEFSMSLAVSGVILTALLSFTVYSAKSFASMENYTDLEQKSQNALDTMTRNVRQARSVSNYTTRTVTGILVTNGLSFIDEDGTLLSYNYTNNVLLQTKSGVTTMLLTNVDFLTFQMFQRNTAAATYNQFPASSISSCKLISVSWVCSRNILGSRINTESVQTAKIVIRKQ
jgi:prepilin-type N-terminal cleavage/methylation domain-containing protein